MESRSIGSPRGAEGDRIGSVKPTDIHCTNDETALKRDRASRIVFAVSQTFFQSLRHVEGDEPRKVVGIISTDLDDLFDERAGSEDLLAASHQKDRLDVSDDPIRRGDFQFGVYFNRIENATKNHARTDLPGELDRQAAVSLDLDVFDFLGVNDQHFLSLDRGEHFFFERIVADRHDKRAVEQGRTADDVQVAVRHRVERTRKDRELVIGRMHGGGL